MSLQVKLPRILDAEVDVTDTAVGIRVSKVTWLHPIVSGPPLITVDTVDSLGPCFLICVRINFNCFYKKKKNIRKIILSCFMYFTYSRKHLLKLQRENDMYHSFTSLSLLFLWCNDFKVEVKMILQTLSKSFQRCSKEIFLKSGVGNLMTSS